MRDESGQFQVRNRRDDLRGNLAAFEELTRVGALHWSFHLDDLCLRNQVNGDVVAELLVPSGQYQCHPDSMPVDLTQHNMMMRFDASMLNPHHRTKQVNDIDIRFSPCMFGSGAAFATTLTGRKLPITERHCHIDEPVWELTVDKRLTLYERESITRLSSTVALLMLGGRISQVVTTLPHGAYYAFLVAPAAQGLVPARMLLEWFDHVDQRSALLQSALERPLRRINPTLKMSQYSVMDQCCDVMRDYVENSVRTGATIDEQELLSLVLATLRARDPFVRFAFELGVPRPTSFLELADLTYGLSILPDMMEPRKEPKLVVGVFDVCENVLWNETRKLRTRGLLQPRGLYNPKPNTTWALDHLSYLAVMPIEQIVLNLSRTFIQEHMGGFERLYAMRDHFIQPRDEQLLFSLLSAVVPQSIFPRPPSTIPPASPLPLNPLHLGAIPPDESPDSLDLGDVPPAATTPSVQVPSPLSSTRHLGPTPEPPPISSER